MTADISCLLHYDIVVTILLAATQRLYNRAAAGHTLALGWPLIEFGSQQEHDNPLARPLKLWPPVKVTCDYFGKQAH